MAKDLVVSDASTLIGLAAAEAFELLRGLFGHLAVSTTVRDEVFAGGDRPGARALSSAAGAPVGSRGHSVHRISSSRRSQSGLSTQWLPGRATSITTIDILSLSSSDKLSCSLFSSSWALWGRAPLGGIGTPLLPNQRTR